MKSVMLFVVLIACRLAYAQEVLVPYRLGDKFGLSDLQGNMVVTPQHDHINYMCKDYFEYDNYTTYKDTVQWVGGRIEVSDEKKTSSGVYHKGKILISGQEHEHYRLVEQRFICGSESSLNSGNSMLYNLKGKKLFPENLDGFQLMHESGLSTTRKEMTKYTAIMVKHYDKSVSFCVYDIDKQAIVYRVLDHVMDFGYSRADNYFDLYEPHPRYFSINCTYTDSLGSYQEKRIAYNAGTGKYSLMAKHKEETTDELEERFGSIGSRGSQEADQPLDLEMMGTPDGPDLPSQPNKAPKIEPVKKVIPQPFKRMNDSLIYYGDSVFTFHSKARFYFSDKKEQTQWHPVIYRVGNKWGLVFSDINFTEPVYDSLIYLNNGSRGIHYNNNFLYYAGIKDPTNKKWSFGILGANGEDLIPLVYDSLFVHLPELRHDYDRRTDKGFFELRDPDSYYNPQNITKRIAGDGLLLAFRNGKYGVITDSNKVILPFEYEGIYRNGVKFLMQVQDDFIILKKDNMYGLMEVNYKKVITKFVKPVFPNLITYYYRDYYDVKGLKILGLSDGASVFFCLANENGLVYYKEK